MSSPDAGIGADADPDLPPKGWVPAIVAVGYKGVRVLSRTLGNTWEAQTELGGGCDDGNWGRMDLPRDRRKQRPQ